MVCIINLINMKVWKKKLWEYQITLIVDGSDENKLGKILTAFINVIKNVYCSKELSKKIKYF